MARIKNSLRKGNSIIGALEKDAEALQTKVETIIRELREAQEKFEQATDGLFDDLARSVKAARQLQDDSEEVLEHLTRRFNDELDAISVGSEGQKKP